MADERKIRVQRDWMDYANTAANLYQAQQISSLNSQFRAQSENEERERRLKDAVFDLVNWLDETVGVIESHPQQVFFVAHTIKNGLKRHQITSSVFSSFADKEWLRSFETRVDRALQDSRKRLTEANYAECVECLSLADEDDLLLTAASGLENIKVLKQQDAALESEIQNLTQLRCERQRHFEQVRLRTRPFCPFLFWSGGIVLLIGLFFRANSDPNSFSLRGSYWMLAGLAILFGGLFLWFRGREELQRLSGQIESLSKKRAAVNASLSELAGNQIPSSWLSKSLNELMLMRIERKDRIEACFGGRTR